MKLGSLFDGSGGFCLAGAFHGIEPVFSSEIEPFCLRVEALRFPNCKQLGSVTDINGAEIEPVDIITFGSPCFPAGTLVLTTDGYIPIEDITVGDMVLTHTGSWKKVTAIGHHESETVILRGNHYGLECTPNHPIYSAEVGKDYSRKENGKRNNKCVLKKGREWTPAIFMDGKYWGVPRKIDQLPFDIPQKTIPKENDMPEMNEDFWYFVGRWVGDGWVYNGKRNDRRNGQRFSTIYICGGIDEEDELIDTVSKISKHYSIERGNTGIKVKINGRLLCDWLARNFGCGATEKTIASWVYGIDSEYRKAFLRGVIDSDGNKIHTVTESWNIATSSEKLANSLRLMAEIEGYSTTVHRYIYNPTTVIDGRVVNVHPENYQVRITASDRTRIHLCDELQSWYKVRSVECTGESKTVYNMTVDEDNSYIANGIVVHNCQDLSVAGKQAGIHEGERSNLFFEAVRIIKEMRHATAGQYPRFAVWENVPGARSSNKGEDFRAVLQSLCSVCDDTVDVPRPDGGGWQPAGCILGNNFSIAWRTYDAQYWGVPQRRKRIYLIADFATGRAGEILLKSESLCWDHQTGREAWETASRYVAGCSDGSYQPRWWAGNDSGRTE